MVRRWTLPVIALAVIGAVVAFGISRSMTRVYQATGSVLVVAGPQQNTGTNNVSLNADEVTATAAALLVEPPLLQKVIADLHLDESTQTLGNLVTATPEPNTELVDVSVLDASPARAAQIDNALMTDFVNEIASENAQGTQQAGTALEAQISQVQSTLTQENGQLAAAAKGTDTTALQSAIASNTALLSQLNLDYSSFKATQAENLETVSVAASATLPTSPTSPQVKVDTVLGGAAGLLVALGLAALVEFLDQGLHDADEVRERLGLTCLAVIPRFDPAATTGRGRRRVEGATEGYRRLRTNLLFAQLDEPLRSLVVTSVRVGEGKTRTAANLAVSLATSDKRILLVDADMRRPGLHRLFRKPLEHGLSDMILAMTQNSMPSVTARHATQYPGLSLLTCGTIPPNPSELLASQRSLALLQSFERAQDLVIIDTPPAAAVTDALSIAGGNATGAILVVEAGRTNAAQATAVIEALKGVGAKVIGVVLNKATQRTYSRYYYYATDTAAQPAAGSLGGTQAESWSPIGESSPALAAGG
jgi:non-specific protein-tyrosine kinase